MEPDKQYFGKKFFESRLNTVLLLVLIVLMIIALKFMFQNKEVYFGISSSKNSIINDPDVLGYKLGEDVSLSDNTPLAGLHIFGISNKNPSGLSLNRYVIFAAETKYITDNLVCGDGTGEFTAPCSIFIKKASGEIVLVGKWPENEAVDETTNFLDNDSLTLIDKNTLWFKSKFSLQCSGEGVQHWHINLETNEITFLNQEGAPLKNDCD